MEKFWDMDVLAVKCGAKEDSVFYSLLGKGGDCYGVAVYEGYEGLNTFMLMAMRSQLNLSPEYAVHHQKNLTCYWGDRVDLTDKQRKIVKDLDYKYRGKNQWMYFMSFEPDFFPFNLDKDEVARMTEHLKDLELLLKCYDQVGIRVDFNGGNMFQLSYGENKNIWSFGEEPLPFTSFEYDELIISDKGLLDNLRSAPKCNAVLEADNCAMMAHVVDKNFDRPTHPMLSIVCDCSSGMPIACELSGPEEDPMFKLNASIIRFIFQNGTPKEIRISNAIVGNGLYNLCEVCGIRLRRIESLQAVDELLYNMKRFM